MGNDYKRHAYRFLMQFGVETIARCQARQYTSILRHFVKKYNAAHSTDITIRGGMARKVLIGRDFVIKLDWDEENVFCYGGCEDEVKLYKIAKEEGFAHLFAEITHITINEYNFYIMPRLNLTSTHLTRTFGHQRHPLWSLSMHP